MVGFFGWEYCKIGDWKRIERMALRGDWDWDWD
jgi:hypothetical protein